MTNTYDIHSKDSYAHIILLLRRRISRRSTRTRTKTRRRRRRRRKRRRGRGEIEVVKVSSVFIFKDTFLN